LLVFHRHLSYFCHYSFLKYFRSSSAIQNASHLSQCYSTLLSIEKIAACEILMLRKQERRFWQNKRLINKAVLLLIFNVFSPGSLIEWLHIATQFQKSTWGMNTLFFLQRGRYSNKIFQTFGYKVQRVRIQIDGRKLGFECFLFQSFNMCLMLSIELPEWRL